MGTIGVIVGTTIQLNGITIDRVTGVITATPITGNRINNFIISVILVVAGVPDPIELPIRVHLHNSISKAWMTPAILTARPDTVKGISYFKMELISATPVVGIVWYSDSTLTERINLFLGNERDPFTVARLAGTTLHVFSSKEIFDNRKYFLQNDVFSDPIFIQILYNNPAGDVTQATIPVHKPHLINTGDIIKDSNGNDLFRITAVTKKPLYRMSVYAIFNDDVMGDITLGHGLRWAAGPAIGANELEIEADTGLFKVFSAAVGTTLTVIATLPAGLGPGIVDVSGQVAVKASWLTEHHQVKRLPGSPVLEEDDVPNVLFIAEGFDNEQSFTRIAIDIHAKLSKVSNRKMLPWNHLFTKSMNAWTLFTTSEETAASIQYENILGNAPTISGRTENVGGSLIEVLITADSLVNPAGGIGLNNLIAICGLPLPSDAGPGVTLAIKQPEWNALYGAGAPNNVSDVVFECWKKLANRKLIEERNSYWGIQCGEKPRRNVLTLPNKVTINQRRATRGTLDLLFAGVQGAASGDTIGEKCWGRDREGKYGKDYGLIVFLVGGLLKAGTRFGVPVFPGDFINSGIAVSLADDVVNLDFISNALPGAIPYFRWASFTNPDKDTWEIDPFNVPARISIPSTGIVAHELAHSFNLHDKYRVMGKTNIPLINGVVPDIIVKTVNKSFNLQLERDLVNNGQFDGGSIKWRWPRIKKAGIIMDAPVISSFGPGITITVRIRESSDDPFKKDEQVNLRKKVVIDTIGVELSPSFVVVENNLTTHTLTLR